MKRLILIATLILSSCVTNDVLQENFTPGMSKFDFEAAGFWRAELDDNPFQTCGYYKYFPDKSIEVFAAKSRKTFYIFSHVTDSRGKCPGAWLYGSNGDGQLLTTANSLTAALETADQYGKRDGQGIAPLPDGDQYVGEIKDGKRDGQGTESKAFHTHDGDQYVGEIKDGKRDGQGTVTSVDGREETLSSEVLDSISKYGSRIAAEIKQKKQAEAEANQKCLQYEDDKGTFKVAEVIYSAVGILKSNSCNQSSYAEERRKFFFEEILAREMIEDVKEGKYPERCSDVISNAINNILEKQKNKGHNSSICQDAKSLLDRFTK